MSSFKIFTHVPLAPWGEYAQQWSMQEEDTGDSDFVTYKSVFSNFPEYKECFL